MNTLIALVSFCRLSILLGQGAKHGHTERQKLFAILTHMTIKQKKTIYFVRHGQSEHNDKPIFQTPDARLSPQGLTQAHAVAERLSSVPFETLITSPYPRAQQTAQVIADKTNHTIIPSDLFVERIRPSALMGKSYDDTAATELHREHIKTVYEPTGKHIQNGENYDDLVARADKALAYLLSRSEATMVVVTHGWFLRVLVARVLLGEQLTGSTLQRFIELITIHNTSLTVLNYKDAYGEDFRWRLWDLNDHAHFAE